MRILYLEDSDYDIDFIRRYVNTLKGSEIIFAKTAEEAVAQLQVMRPDLFLVDVVIDGETVYDIIRMAFAQNLARHVVLLTARALPSEVQYYRSLGCQHVIAKPFTVDELDRLFLQIA